MRKSLILMLITGFMLNVPTLALASPCPAESNPITEGQVAPCTGVLVSPEGVAKIVANTEAQKRKCNLNIAEAKEKAKAHCSVEINILTLQLEEEQDSFARELANNQEEIDKLQKIVNSQNKPKNGLWFAAGATTGVAFAILTTWAIGQVINN